MELGPPVHPHPAGATMPIFTAEERVGRTLGGRYVVQALLARGGMGIVYEGWDAFASRNVAIKLLKPELLLGDPTTVRRFLREVRAVGTLRHPNLVEVFDAGEDTDGATYLVLERLRGEGLETRLARSPVPPDEAVSLLLPVLDALEAVHGGGIVHRDVKPDNIYLHRDASGWITPKLLDFGIAKVAESGTRHTQTGFVLGTPEYMSPEQARGAEDVGPEADVWALAVVLYECLTGGRLPFPGESGADVMLRVLTGAPVPLRDVAPHVPEGLCEAVGRALDAEPERRLGTVAAFRAALLEAADAHGLDLLPDGWPGSPPRDDGPGPAPEVAPGWRSPTEDRRLVEARRQNAPPAPAVRPWTPMVATPVSVAARTSPPPPGRAARWVSLAAAAAVGAVLVVVAPGLRSPARGAPVVGSPPGAPEPGTATAGAPDPLPSGRGTPAPTFVWAALDAPSDVGGADLGGADLRGAGLGGPELRGSTAGGGDAPGPSGASSARAAAPVAATPPVEVVAPSSARRDGTGDRSAPAPRPAPQTRPRMQPQTQPSERTDDASPDRGTNGALILSPL